MDDWHTIDNKKKHRKTDNIHALASSLNSSKGSIKIVQKAEFQNYKKIYGEVTFAMSELFDNINKMVNTSSQYLSSKQINHNQHNHNKWHSKDINDCEVDIQVNALFNKLSVSNIQAIMADIKAINISAYDEMVKITEIIYDKCVGNALLALLYVKVIKHIMMNYAWIVYDDHCKPVSFRKILVDKMEHDFNYIVDSIRSGAETTDTMKLHRKAFFTMIGSMFNECIFGDQLFRFIFASIEGAFIRTQNNEFMDYWLIMSLWANKVWKTTNPEYLNEKKLFIRNNNDLFNGKIKLLTKNLDDLKLDNSDDVVIENDETPQSAQHTDDPGQYKGYVIVDLIDSVTEHGDMSEWFEEMCEVEEKAPGIINKIISTLSTKVTDLKSVFGLLLFLKKKEEYTELVLDSVSAFSSITSCKAYVNNAKKLLKNRA